MGRLLQSRWDDVSSYVPAWCRRSSEMLDLFDSSVTDAPRRTLWNMAAPFAEAVAATGGRSVRRHERNLELDAQDLDAIRTNLAGGPG